jgi:hypothetical protein
MRSDVSLGWEQTRNTLGSFPGIPACTVEPYRQPARLMFEGEFGRPCHPPPRVLPAVRIKIVNGD